MSDIEFKTIVADPAWNYNSNQLRASPSHRPNSWNKVTGGVSSVDRYGGMSVEEICKLQIPSSKNAHLYLWTTNAFMEEAHQVAKAWGFAPKTIITWVKTKADGITPSMKMGYYYRGASEHILFCVKGKLRLRGSCAPTWFSSTRLSHSSKPEKFYKLVEEQSHPDYLELFARKKREGWYSWGNQIDSDLQINQTNTLRLP